MENLKKPAEPAIIKYLNAKAAQAGTPLNLTFELTSRCNFSCKMCYVHSESCNKDKASELTAKQWIDIAQSAKNAGAVFILLTGGEPFVREDFCEIYEAIAKMGFVISLNTNLSLLTDKILETLKNYPPRRINVSLYGMSDETYISLCGLPAFGTVRENITKLIKNGLPVKINSSITGRNEKDLEKMMVFCDGLGIPYKATGYMFPSARLGIERERLEPRGAAEIRARIDRHCFTDEDYNDRIRRIRAGIELEKSGDCPEENDGMDRIRCRAGKTSAWIDRSGNMSFCGMIPADERLNVTTLGLEKCWQAVREKAAAVRMPSKCSSCEYKHICIICAASQFCETGGYDDPPEAICEIAKNTLKEYEKLRR